MGLLIVPVFPGCQLESPSRLNQSTSGSYGTVSSFGSRLISPIVFSGLHHYFPSGVMYGSFLVEPTESNGCRGWPSPDCLPRPHAVTVPHPVLSVKRKKKTAPVEAASCSGSMPAILSWMD